MRKILSNNEHRLHAKVLHHKCTQANLNKMHDKETRASLHEIASHIEVLQKKWGER